MAVLKLFAEDAPAPGTLASNSGSGPRPPQQGYHKAFVRQALDSLLARTGTHSTGVLEAMSAYLGKPRDKSVAGQLASMSRSSFYQPLTTTEEALGIDLNCVTTCSWLNAAVMALHAGRRRATIPVGASCLPVEAQMPGRLPLGGPRSPPNASAVKMKP
jgi:hypothetical protein